MVHEQAFIPTTHRPSGLLANAYGYATLEAFVESIPPRGTIVDVGAGESNFGVHIAEERSDVGVTLMDPCYRSGRYNKTLHNLHYVPGDILAPTLMPGSFDRVTSSALLPHIVRVLGPDLAIRAVHNMAELLKPNGTMQVAGFVRYFSITGAVIGPVVTIGREQYDESPNDTARMVVAGLSRNPIRAVMQDMATVGGYYASRFAPGHDL